MHVFSLDGKFLKAKSFGTRFPMLMALGPNDLLYVLGAGFLKTRIYYELVKLDEDLNLATVF